jgi:hypothetical protein
LLTDLGDIVSFSILILVLAANPVGAVSEFNAQLQILELLDNVSFP